MPTQQFFVQSSQKACKENITHLNQQRNKGNTSKIL